MTMAKEGLDSRELRVRHSQGGIWGSSSQDFVHLAQLLYEHSATYADRSGGNCSVYTLAGIPMLLSALRCLLIELNADIAVTGRANQALLDELARPRASELQIIFNYYPIPPALRDRLELLVQVRHEILHPAHRPSGEPGSTPAYLRALREAKLLESTGATADYMWLEQLKSHRLFRWAFETVALTVDVLLAHHNAVGFAADGIRESWWRFGEGPGTSLTE